MGTLAGSALGEELLRQAIRAVRDATDLPFAVNLINAFPIEDLFLVLVEEKVTAVSFFWGVRPEVIQRAKAEGMTVLQTVAYAEEVQPALEAGADVIVCQGVEAGGHVWSSIGLIASLPEVVAASGDVPVLAAGGIVDGRSMAAAGVWMGTRFLASEESGAHANYKQRLMDADAASTCLQTVYDVGWPEAQSRALLNSTLKTWEDAGRPKPGDRPGEDDTVATAPDGTPIPRYYVDVPIEGTTGDVEAMAHYAGQGVGSVREIAPAADIVNNTVKIANKLLGDPIQGI